MRKIIIENYLDLIGEVAKIDIQAAMYLRYEAVELTSFISCPKLSNAFLWSITPQGHNYWENIVKILADKGLQKW